MARLMIRRVVLVDEPVFLGVEAFEMRVFAVLFLVQLHPIELVNFLVVICRFLLARRLRVGRRLYFWALRLYGAFTIATHDFNLLYNWILYQTSPGTYAVPSCP